MTAPSLLGAWLRGEREKRLWTRVEMARQLIKAAENHGDATMPGVDHVAHCIYRWERGIVGPSERYRLYYCAAFGITLTVSASSKMRRRRRL